MVMRGRFCIMTSQIQHYKRDSAACRAINLLRPLAVKPTASIPSRPLRGAVTPTRSLKRMNTGSTEHTSPAACKAASFLDRVRPFVVSPTALTPGRLLSAAVSSTRSLRKVGSPPVSLILLTPALANMLACSTAHARSEHERHIKLFYCFSHCVECDPSAGASTALLGYAAQPHMMPPAHKQCQALPAEQQG